MSHLLTFLLTMNWFLTPLIILFSFGISFIVLLYVANYLVKPRWPEWWSKNVSELDPDDLLVGNTRRKRFTTTEFFALFGVDKERKSK